MIRHLFNRLIRHTLVLMGLIAISLPAVVQAQTISGQLTGGVTDFTGVTVSAKNAANDNEFGSASASGTGAFSISVPSAGANYDVNVHIPVGIELTTYAGVVVTLAVDGTLTVVGSAPLGTTVSGTSLNITLSTGSQVSGTVTDGANNPIANVDVFAYDSSSDVGASAITNVTGGYTLNLPNGSYDFDFVPEIGTAFTPAFQDNVAVSGLTTVNQTLSAGNQISGVVTQSSDSSGVSDAEVHAFNKSTGEFGFALTNSSGNYTLRVPAGTYEVDAFPAPGSGLAPALPVSVDASSGNANQDFSLDGGVTISGTVTEAASTRAAGDLIGDVAIDAFDFSTGNFGFGVSNAAGVYSIPVAKGTYNLHVFPPLNSEFLPASGIEVDVSSASTVKNINLKKGNSVLGRVVNCSGSAGIEGVEVLVFSRTNFQAPPSFTSTTETGGFRIPVSDGEFEIVAFPPHDQAFSFVTGEITVANGVVSSTGSTCSGALPLVSSGGTLQIGLTGASGLPGVIFGDADGSGAQNGTERGIPNAGIAAFPSSFSSFRGPTGGSSAQPAFGFSEPDGAFFLALTAGTYELMVFLEPGASFVPPQLGTLTVTGSGGTATFSLTPSGGSPTTITSLNIAATKGLTISGKITDVDGTTGIPRAGINLWPAFDPNQPFDFTAGAFGDTDNDGNYSMAVRPPTSGTQNLEFSVFFSPTSGKLPPPFLRLSLASTGGGTFSIPSQITDPFSGTTSSYTKPSEYTFSQSTAGAATTINGRAQSGNTLSGVTYVDVSRTANAFDSGTDRRVGNVTLIAFPRFEEGTDVDFSAFMPGFTQSDNNGNYSMILKAGKYELNVDTFGSFNEETGEFIPSTEVIDPVWIGTFPNSELVVDVTQGDTTLNVQLASSTGFPGTVRKGDGTGLPCIPINAWVVPSSQTTPTGGWLGPTISFADTNRQGDFTLNLPNGTFEVGAEIEFGGCFGPGFEEEEPPLLRDSSRAPVNPAHEIVVVSGGVLTGNLNFSIVDGVALTGIAKEEDRFGGGFRGVAQTFPLSFRQLVLFCGSPEAEVARGFTEFDGSFTLNVPKNRTGCRLVVEDWGFTGSTFRTLKPNISTGTADQNLGTLVIRYVFIQGLLKNQAGVVISNGQIRAVDPGGNEVGEDFLFDRGTDPPSNFRIAVPQGSGQVTLKLGTTSATPTVNVTTTADKPDGTVYTVSLARVIGQIFKDSATSGNELKGVGVSIIDQNGNEVVNGNTAFEEPFAPRAITAGSLVSFDQVNNTEIEGIFVPKGTFRVQIGGAFATGGNLSSNGTFTIGDSEIGGVFNLGNLVLTLLEFGGTINSIDSPTLFTNLGTDGIFVNIMSVDDFRFITGFQISGSECCAFNPSDGTPIKGKWGFSVAPNIGEVRMTYFDETNFVERVLTNNENLTLTIGGSPTSLTLKDGGVFDPFAGPSPSR